MPLIMVVVGGDGVENNESYLSVWKLLEFTFRSRRIRLLSVINKQKLDALMVSSRQVAKNSVLAPNR